MRRLGVAVLIASGSFFLAACDRTSDKVTDGVRHEPVVVYAAIEDDAGLRDVFARYTEESGVLVIVRRGIAADIVDDLIENRISPPADMLVTSSVVDIWRAAEEGALRPLFSEAVHERSPAWSRDPDDLWFGTSYRTAVIAHDMPDLTGAEVPDYAALAEARFATSVCLSSAANAVNRTVIAMMIETMGVRPAEIAVRGWMANLALPVFDTEAQLIAAIHAGSCRIGIVSSTALAIAMTDNAHLDLAVLTPATTYADVDGIGVARHARNPDGAAALLEWMFSTDVQATGSSKNLTYPVNASAKHAEMLDAAGAKNISQKNVGLVAWHEVEAVKLAERARYRR
ncbi:MAG: extracellular solute-binding protein [Gammaproteobacteria bacterium]|jgi:iron(III) transport system substrate-binding protein|nr:extracellular solute-binding protein [Gammaproteobacteria bacterium]MDH3750674.1 extracellular solute-binding protein [Gammaproteobacteria bacterium]MDH3806067.1 extracellular solute-binding protein [Gammaproteobacteria bacterium]